MEVILTANVAKVGKKYDIKKVASGFGRNFLIPKGLAKLATPEEVAKLEAEKAQYQKVLMKKHQDLLDKFTKVKDKALEIKAKASEEGHLYAGLTASDIAVAFQEKEGVEMDPTWIILEKPIKSVGSRVVKIKSNPFKQEAKDKEEFVELKVEIQAE